jgi:PAS domain S-box-containing protein
MGFPGGAVATPRNPNDVIRMLQQELADTNREVLALTLELEKRLEELRAAEQRYRRLAENAPDAIFRFELHPQRGYTFVNPRVTELTGYSREEYYADPELSVKAIHSEDRALAEEILSGEGAEVGMFTLRWLSKWGQIIWIEQHHVMVRDAQGCLVAIECIARDITSRKLLEEQFLQAQKMEAVGRLAGGVAHDFNNLLTVINGYSEQALEALPENDPLQEDITEIRNAGERAAALTRQLLAFSRRQVLKPEVFDLNIVLAGMHRMLLRLLGEDIVLSTEPYPGLDFIYADRGQIEQVIMNLVVNAREAMPGGGRLTIETANVTLDSGYPGMRRSVAPGDYVLLAVTDTGSGMDDETQRRIFEPFFTTKSFGTGLGLSTVFGIIQQSGGTIWVYSVLGRGTTFKIYFPKTSEGPNSDISRPLARSSRGSETILLVEDEDGVRKLLRSALEGAGYSVMDARSGPEALALCEIYPDVIHLVVTDVVMPQMSGRELASRLATLRPDTKLLFMSGYTDHAMVQHWVLGADTTFLQKPFAPSTLAAKVRQILDARLR